MQGCFFLGCENAGAFHHNVNIAPGQFFGIADGCHADRATANIDRVFADFDLDREAAVNAVVLQKVCVRFDRAQVVDSDDFDIRAAGFNDGAQNVTSDATKAVNGYLNSHGCVSPGVSDTVTANNQRQAIKSSWRVV